MTKKEVERRIEKLIRPYRITSGKGFRLKDIDPGDTQGVKSEAKGEAKLLLQRGVSWLAEQQDVLYAQDRWALLLAFQAMDAAGKDGTIKHVMSGVNPQGCEVNSFKQPSSEELDHDYLWRYLRHTPERGRIGIFNRSYYEEVLVVQVHKELLARQKIPSELVTKRIWQERYEDIVNFERYLGATASWCSSSFCTSRSANRSAGSWRGWTNPRRTGSFPRRTCASAATGTSISGRIKTSSATLRRRTRHGMSCLPITSGSQESWLRRPWPTPCPD